MNMPKPRYGVARAILIGAAAMSFGYSVFAMTFDELQAAVDAALRLALTEEQACLIVGHATHEAYCVAQRCQRVDGVGGAAAGGALRRERGDGGMDLPHLRFVDVKHSAFGQL